MATCTDVKINQRHQETTTLCAAKTTHKPLCHASLVLLSYVLLHPEHSVMLPFAVGSANLGVSVGVTLCSRRSIHAVMTLLEDTLKMQNMNSRLPL